MILATVSFQISSQKHEVGPQMIQLRIENNPELLELSLDKPINLGRESDSDIYTTVDLTDLGGAKKGVSRCHARILKKNGILTIVDRGSLHGTFVNARQLTPFIPRPINHDDYLHLGRLLIHIKIS